jgi:predicted DNA-binding transcriptional regulator AlpA
MRRMNKPNDQCSPIERALGKRSQASQDAHAAGGEPRHARPWATGPPFDGLEVHRVISEAQAAHVLGVSSDTLRRLSARGEGPKRLKLSPRRVGYLLSDCLEWLRAREPSETAT